MIYFLLIRVICVICGLFILIFYSSVSFARHASRARRQVRLMKRSVLSALSMAGVRFKMQIAIILTSVVQNAAKIQHKARFYAAR